MGHRRSTSAVAAYVEPEVIGVGAGATFVNSLISRQVLAVAGILTCE
jgi:hypothetical protein